MEERRNAKIKTQEELKTNPNYVVPVEDFVSNNTILEYARHIIFEKLGHFKLSRPVKHGGPR